MSLRRAHHYFVQGSQWQAFRAVPAGSRGERHVQAKRQRRQQRGRRAIPPRLPHQLVQIRMSHRFTPFSAKGMLEALPRQAQLRVGREQAALHS